MYHCTAILLLVPTVLAGTVLFPIRRNDDKEQYQLNRRGTVSSSLANVRNLYEVDVTVGTGSAQNIKLQIDTGSSDVWLPATSSTQCAKNGCPYGTFDPAKSTTYQFVGSHNDFDITYLDKTGTIGDHFNDTIAIGASKIPKFTMALGTQLSGVTEGVMGIGYRVKEVGVNKYPTIVEAMVSGGLIPTNAYSLWLNSATAKSGSILFGGIDTYKFLGDLAILNMISQTDLTVSLTGLSAIGSTGKSTRLGSTSYSHPVILDSGTALTIIPDALFTDLNKVFSLTYNSTNQIYILPCSARTTVSTISFQLGGSSGATIAVGIKELVLDYEGDTCALGIVPATLPGEKTSVFILGDTFLRSAYVFFDLANNQAGIAQAVFSEGSNIVPFKSRGATIPTDKGVTYAPPVSVATPTASTSTTRAVVTASSASNNGAAQVVSTSAIPATTATTKTATSNGAAQTSSTSVAPSTATARSAAAQLATSFEWYTLVGVGAFYFLL